MSNNTSFFFICQLLFCNLSFFILLQAALQVLQAAFARIPAVKVKFPVKGGFRSGFNLLAIRVTRVIITDMKDRDLLKLLLKDGWELVSVKGSHHKITKGEKTEILPVHGKDIKKGLLSAILKRTGLEVNK